MYGELRSFPLSKLDRSATIEQCNAMLIDEEVKLPTTIEISWPEKYSVADGQIFEGPVVIGKCNKMTELYQRKVV